MPRLSELKVQTLLTCCGSRKWAKRVLERGPYASAADLYRVAEEVWNGLDEADWLEAFSHHPQIGAKVSGLSHEARQEQAGAQKADPAVLAKLRAGNEAYEKKFGFVFLVCATGKSAEEMLELLETRLTQTRESEIKTAAGEQSKITRLRLEKWLNE